MLHDTNNVYDNFYLGGVPNATKTYNSKMAVSNDGTLFAYCVGKVVVVRKSANDYKDDTVIFNNHRCKTTAVDIHPNGIFAASGDEEGNLKIWFMDDGCKKFNHQPISSSILGLHWSEKGDRILVYGMSGKDHFARYVSWDTCNNMGEITGMSKNTICGDLRRSRPYMGIVCSEDLSMRVYKGTNLMPHYINKQHNRFICCTKFSPKGDRFAVVGLDKRIVIYETDSGKQLEEFSKEFENQHTNGIISVLWLNENFLATASMDKTVKIWDLKNKKSFTLNADKEGGSTGDDYMQHGLVRGKDYLISLNLNGTLNLWSTKNFDDSQGQNLEAFSVTPDKRIYGHAHNLTNVKYSFVHKKLFSADTLGRISKFSILIKNNLNFINSCMG